MVGSRAEYLAQFAGATTQRIVGEASPFYLYSRTAAREICAFCPDAFIVIMVRNPVDVMYSLFNERRFYATFLPGQETITDFGEALAAESARQRGERLPAGAPPEPGRAFYLFYRDLVRFPEQIERYLALFRRVHFVVFDDLQRDPAGTFRAVCEFLEVDPEFRPRFSIENPQKRARSRLLSRAVFAPSPRLLGIARTVLPQSIRRPLARLVARAAAGPGPAPPMDPALRDRLLEDVRPEVIRLGALLGRDLSHWVAGS
jgi:hypothetical protein